MGMTTDQPASTGPQFDLDHIFSAHELTEEQQDCCAAVREAARGFALIVDTVVPSGADKSAAIRLISDAMMTANAGIARKGRLHK